MATKAERYAKGELKWENNEQLAAAVDDVEAAAERMGEAIRLELETGLTYDADSRTTRSLRQTERSQREKELENSTYAYRFEILDDDSVVEIRVEKAGATPKLTAMTSLVSSPAGAVAGGLGAPPPDDAEG